MSEEKKEMKKSSSPAKDLTVGSPMKLILGFAFPMFLGLLFQQSVSYTHLTLPTNSRV